MASPVLKGSSDPQLQYWELDYSPVQGGKVAAEYKGIDLGKMSALCNQLSGGGCTVKLRYEKNVATLSAETTRLTGNIPGGVNPPVTDFIDKWEISVDQERPELFENRNWLALFTSANSTYSVRIDQQVAHIIRQVANSSTPTWKGVWDRLTTTNIVTNSGSDYAGPVKLSVPVSALGTVNVKYFADDYLRGRTNFVHGKYLLRHTTNAPDNFGPNQADFNVEKIYSISQLLSECQSSSLWVLPLPGYLAYKILSYPVPANLPPNYMWGALKLGSNALTAARNRVEIVTEYLIDACPIHTYGTI